MNIRTLVKHGLNLIGIDIIRSRNSPRLTLLGLKHLEFGGVVDVGANEGQFARYISKFFPDAKLYCFEPLDAPFNKLVEWADTQNNRVACFQFALGDCPGEAVMHLHEQHTPSSSLLASTDTCHTLYPQTQAEHLTRIQVSTLDKALGDALDSMPRDILLKLDVQGFEDRVLRGGRQVLSQCRAVILEINLDPMYSDQANFQDLMCLLWDANFRYAGNLDQIYGEDGRVLWLDAVFLK